MDMASVETMDESGAKITNQSMTGDILKNVPLRALCDETKARLASFLDLEVDDFSRDGYVKNYEGLGELLSFDMSGFTEGNKTISVLEKWQKKDPRASLGQLWSHLEDLECSQITEDSQIRSSILHDAEIYRMREEQLQMHKTFIAPNYTGGCVDKYEYAESKADEYKDMFVSDVERFDAFVSFSEKDIWFVKEMINMLEREHGLKLCIPQRDFTIGTSYNTITAKVIADHCRKMIVVMSKNFLLEQACDFQMKFAMAISRGSLHNKMVPIMLERITMPQILESLTAPLYEAEAEKGMVHIFWKRVKMALEGSKDFPTLAEWEQDKVGELTYPWNFGKHVDFDELMKTGSCLMDTTGSEGDEDNVPSDKSASPNTYSGQTERKPSFLKRIFTPSTSKCQRTTSPKSPKSPNNSKSPSLAVDKANIRQNTSSNQTTESTCNQNMPNTQPNITAQAEEVSAQLQRAPDSPPSTQQALGQPAVVSKSKDKNKDSVTGEPFKRSKIWRNTSQGSSKTVPCECVSSKILEYIDNYLEIIIHEQEPGRKQQMLLQMQAVIETRKQEE